jgi:hypothetical protein
MQERTSVRRSIAQTPSETSLRQRNPQASGKTFTDCSVAKRSAINCADAWPNAVPNAETCRRHVRRAGTAFSTTSNTASVRLSDVTQLRSDSFEPCVLFLEALAELCFLRSQERRELLDGELGAEHRSDLLQLEPKVLEDQNLI